jgi:vitamin B12 transporter
MNKTILAASIAAALSLTQTVAFAEDDTLIVTATRTAQTADQTLASVSVITKEDIDKYQFKTLVEAIGGLPGVNFTNSGGPGKLTSIFIRGVESNHTQILLNGAKLATNSFGSPQIDHIPLNLIERIELVRGPQSSLYGSGSIGGTIQIFTKRGAGKLTPHVSVGFGTHDTKETAFGVSGGDSSTWYSLSGGYVETGGFNLCNDQSICDQFTFDLASRDDNDGYKNSNASLRVGHKLTNNSHMEFFSLYGEGDVSTDGYINQTDFMQHTYGFNVATDVSDKWSIKSTLSQGRYETDNRNLTAPYGPVSLINDNQQDNFSVQSDIQIDDNSLMSIGYDYEDVKIDTSNNFTINKRHSNAVFLQLLSSYGSSNHQVTLRNENNEQFGSQTTGNISWGTSITPAMNFNASFGTAFVAPSLTDLYYPSYDSTPWVCPPLGVVSTTCPASNPSLEPERSKTYELGLNGRHSDISWSANVYHTKIKNFIDLDVFSIPENTPEVIIKGLELQASTSLVGVHVDGQFTWIDAENTGGGDNDGNVLARRAEQTFTLNANKSFGDFSVATKVFVSGRRFDKPDNITRLAGFTTVDLTGGYRVNQDLTARVKVSNLFNEEYETVAGYKTDGTNVFFSLNYQPAN